MKKEIRSKCSLSEMLFRLLQFSNHKNVSKNLNDNKSQISDDKIINSLSKNLLLKNISDCHTNFAYEKCLIEFAKASSLKSNENEKEFVVISQDPQDNFKYNLHIENEKLFCSCYYSKQWGLPCSHMFAVGNLNIDKFSKYIHLNRRWKSKIDDDKTDNDLLKYLKEVISQADPGKNFYTITFYLLKMPLILF